MFRCTSSRNMPLQLRAGLVGLNPEYPLKNTKLTDQDCLKSIKISNFFAIIHACCAISYDTKWRMCVYVSGSREVEWDSIQVVSGDGALADLVPVLVRAETSGLGNSAERICIGTYIYKLTDMQCDALDVSDRVRVSRRRYTAADGTTRRAESAARCSSCCTGDRSLYLPYSVTLFNFLKVYNEWAGTIWSSVCGSARRCSLIMLVSHRTGW